MGFSYFQPKKIFHSLDGAACLTFAAHPDIIASGNAKQYDSILFRK
jgi:hypothetical protein